MPLREMGRFDHKSSSYTSLVAEVSKEGKQSGSVRGNMGDGIYYNWLALHSQYIMNNTYKLYTQTKVKQQ